MTRPYYWSVRRELWENRFVYLAPLIVCAVVLFAALVSNTFSLPDRVTRAAADTDLARRHSMVVSHLSLPPAPIMLSTFIVAMFYCLDALYGERRDRSILFWKSLPVSDRTVVLSKLSVPMLVLPAFALILGITVQIILFVHGTLVLTLRGVGPGLLWREFRFMQEPIVMLYGTVVHVLWYAPIYGWLLLVSAWAKRVPLVWAVMPLMVISAFEKGVFGSMNFMNMLQYRVGGAMKEAFVFQTGAIDEFSQLSIGRYVSRPGLWGGLLFAFLCVVLAIHLRRKREPI
ncbi:MAG TPA: ABC transporter permease [Thermoanaerobaculia bacterium]|nr:ABC transporter permease [Thermoanaerobaculia bacterium]